MNRTEAVALLHEYTASESLRRHALAVEGALRAYAMELGEDPELWGVTGLLHDFDYEMHPRAPDHPLKGSVILAERGVDGEIRQAILGHVPETGVPRSSRLAVMLYACDELCGFLVACALVRPDRFEGLAWASVRKKLKDKAFARSVSREEIQAGVEEAGLNMEAHTEFLIQALRRIPEVLGP
ncbi:MAG: HDIG domain-containing metalloprotein [Bacteroidota bacterium]